MAAVIAEPIAFRQAIKVPHDGYFPALRDICTRHGALLIVDEVITGFGRTGRMFGLDHWATTADVLTVAKGHHERLRPARGRRRVGRDRGGVRRRAAGAHQQPTRGHPVSCRAAPRPSTSSSARGLVENAARGEALVRECMERLRDELGCVRHISARGLLTSVEIELPGMRNPPADAVRRICHECYERGVILRSAAEGQRAAVYFYPPLVVSADEIREAFAAIADARGSSSQLRSGHSECPHCGGPRFDRRRLEGFL